MPGWTFTTADEDTQWNDRAFIQSFYKSLNEKLRVLGQATVPIPDTGTDIQKGGSTSSFDVGPQAVTSITRSGNTATATCSAHGYVVGDIVCLCNVAQRQYDGLHTITAKTTNTFDYAVTGSPATPATPISGSMTVVKTTDMHASMGQIQSALESIAASFMNTDPELIENSTETQSWSWTLASWRSACGINSAGFMRKKPRVIVSLFGTGFGSSSVDADGNTIAAGQKAYGQSASNGGTIHRYNAVTEEWEPTELAKSVTTLTRSGTTATATVTGHGYITGDSVRIAGATQPEYDHDVVITVTGANTFTFVVTGTPATPATGTITAAALIPGPPDLLASDQAAPNHCAYGIQVVGDYIGPWLFNEVRQGLDHLIKDVVSWSADSAVAIVASSVTQYPTWDDAKNQAAASEASAGFGGAIRSYYRGDGSSGGFVALYEASQARAKTGAIFSIRHASCEIDFYGWAEKNFNGGSQSSATTFTNEFDDEGLGYTENTHNLLDTIGREGDTATTTATSSVTVGTAEAPTECDQPLQPPSGIDQQIRGYTITTQRAVRRWDVADGFEFYTALDD